MSNTNTGGPAFPTPSRWDSEGNWAVNNYEDNGMTLRDYFAAKAMQGLMDAAMPMPEIADAAYVMADAMLKAREA